MLRMVAAVVQPVQQSVIGNTFKPAQWPTPEPEPLPKEAQIEAQLPDEIKRKRGRPKLGLHEDGSIIMKGGRKLVPVDIEEMLTLARG